MRAFVHGVLADEEWIVVLRIVPTIRLPRIQVIPPVTLRLLVRYWEPHRDLGWVGPIILETW